LGVDGGRPTAAAFESVGRRTSLEGASGQL
jgi:hypothetical protein